ncbi:MAG: hypothetical protein JNN30_15550 [Rhodanobacteraceae bacterium]|nr:hypothetical protein [Rhodanobacteraceae bacterium]
MYARSPGAALLLLATLTAAQAADEQVFEPGSKHVCIPASSGEGWDCRSASSTAETAAETEKKPRELRLRSSSEIPDEASRTDSAAQASVEPTQTAPAASAAAPRTGSRNVPHYLLAPEARAATTSPAAAKPAAAAQTATAATAEPATATTSVSPAPVPESSAPVASPAAAAPTSADAPADTPAQSVVAGPATPPPVAPSTTAPESSASAATAAASTGAADPGKSPAAESATASSPAEPPPPPLPRPTDATNATTSAPQSGDTALLGSTEFRRLGDSRYVIELASGARRDLVENEAGKPTQGQVYLLPLTRNGAAWYVAVWGDFESVDAARNAREQALASGMARIGWPRRAGPLKQELSREAASE